MLDVADANERAWRRRKTAEAKTAAPRVQTSPVIVTQAKVNCTDWAFSAFGVCVACGGVQGLHTWAAQPPLAKNGRDRGGMDDLSLEFCSCEAGDELLPH